MITLILGLLLQNANAQALYTEASQCAVWDYNCLISEIRAQNEIENDFVDIVYVLDGFNAHQEFNAMVTDERVETEVTVEEAFEISKRTTVRTLGMNTCTQVETIYTVRNGNLQKTSLDHECVITVPVERRPPLK